MEEQQSQTMTASEALSTFSQQLSMEEQQSQTMTASEALSRVLYIVQSLPPRPTPEDVEEAERLKRQSIDDLVQITIRERGPDLPGPLYDLLNDLEVSYALYTAKEEIREAERKCSLDNLYRRCETLEPQLSIQLPSSSSGVRFRRVDEIIPVRRRVSVSEEIRHENLTERIQTWMDQGVKSLNLVGKLTAAIHIIPEEFAHKLAFLEDVNLSSNHLHSLPQSFGLLSLLKVLSVERNLLEHLPSSISKCKLLSELRVGHNRLQILENFLGQLTSLRILSAPANQIKQVDVSMEYMMELTDLDLSSNCLSYIHEDVCLAPSLSVLNLSRNFEHLTSLPESLGSLQRLQQLNISYNQIDKLPASFQQLNLQVIYFQGTPLYRRVDEGISSEEIIHQLQNLAASQNVAVSKHGKGSKISRFFKSTGLNKKKEA